MEISVRDWMIIIGVLLIVAVLLDGYRRNRDPGRVRVSLTQVPESGDSDDDAHLRTELPNGGARVIGRDDDAEPSPDDGGEDATDGSRADPPLLTESPVAGPGENLDLLAGIGAVDAGSDSAARVNPEDTEVFMLHVVARDERGFSGDDILQVLLAFELRFGEMNFFHRHEQAAGRGAIQFSVANMLKPGVFDIDNMSAFSTTGLIFFLTLPGPRDMMGAFDLMVETAQGVADNLGGDLLDETRSVTTRQTLEHMRQRIRDLERRMLARAQRQE